MSHCKKCGKGYPSLYEYHSLSWNPDNYCNCRKARGHTTQNERKTKWSQSFDGIGIRKLADRKPTPHRYYCPRAIVKQDDGYAILHGPDNVAGTYAWKPTLTQAMLLILEWKKRGHCESWHIDNLFIFGKIEF